MCLINIGSGFRFSNSSSLRRFTISYCRHCPAVPFTSPGSFISVLKNWGNMQLLSTIASSRNGIPVVETIDIIRRICLLTGNASRFSWNKRRMHSLNAGTVVDMKHWVPVSRCGVLLWLHSHRRLLNHSALKSPNRNRFMQYQLGFRCSNLRPRHAQRYHAIRAEWWHQSRYRMAIRFHKVCASAYHFGASVFNQQ